MSEYMTAGRFVAKVDWEGGIGGALNYGLTADELDPNDEASKPLRKAWADLERLYREEYEPAADKVRRAMDAIDPDGPEG